MLLALDVLVAVFLLAVLDYEVGRVFAVFTRAACNFFLRLILRLRICKLGERGDGALSCEEREERCACHHAKSCWTQNYDMITGV